MLKRYFLSIFLFTITTPSFALAPAPGLTVKNTLGEITSYDFPGKDIEVNSVSSSDFKYEDLTQKETSALKDFLTAKQEYGKMFGFEDWKMTGQKLVEKNGERIVLIQGTYKDAQKKTVNFIEVYWANKEKAGQYLITSDTLALKMENYSDYLK